MMNYKHYETLKSHIESGMTTKEIADKYSVDRKSIEYWYKKFNLKANKPKRPKQTDIISIEEVIALLNEGFLIKDICEMYGIQRNAISRLLKANGYNMKNHAGQRQHQSQLMSTELNPTLGTKRPKEVIEAMVQARRTANKSKWETIDTYDEYTKTARSIAYSYFNEGADVPEGYEIDHKFSLKDCYANNIPVWKASHVGNLQFLTSKENKKKGSTSCISLEEFKKLTEEAKE